MPDYTTGSIAPRLQPDAGSGPWCADAQSARMLLYQRALEAALGTGALELFPGSDAARQMRLYLANTGHDLPVDVAALLARSAQLSQQCLDELALAHAYAQGLPAGRHDIRSTRVARGYFRQRQDANLFFAIGGYAHWGRGTVRVHLGDNGRRHYEMDFAFEFFDRYNWDSGKTVRIAGIEITDAFMQQFHRQCHAREYDLRGALRQRLRWDHGQAPQVVRDGGAAAVAGAVRP